jgi:hypothetical protein
MLRETFKLANGVEIARIGLRAWGSCNSVISPIRAGHYHIDTADLLYGLNAELTLYARQTIVPGFSLLFFQFTVPAADMGTSIFDFFVSFLKKEVNHDRVPMWFQASL